MDRFWKKVDMNPHHCWEWQAGKLRSGYGSFRISDGTPGGKAVLAHRFAYELLIGPIPEGLHIDHLCRNRACVNPEHMEPVTPRENSVRGGVYKRLDTCRSGRHYLSEKTTSGQCRKCYNEYAKAWRKAKQACES